nr:hypothetical protein CFP56_58746 [Quercus suber]
MAKTTTDLITPARDAQVGFEIPSSDETSEAGMFGVEYPDLDREEHVDDGSGTSSNELEHDDDVYDEFGQTVLKSQAHDAHEHSGSSHDHTDHDMGEAASEEEHLTTEDNHTVTEATSHGALGYPAEASQGNLNTQPLAIADSQTGQQKPQRSSLANRLSAPSPKSSYLVPGSQYTGKTSEEQAPYSSMWKKAAGDYGQRNDLEIVPSSPPVPQVGSALPGDSPFPHHESSMLESRRMRTRTIQQEIPESDIPDATETGLDIGLIRTAFNGGKQSESHGVAPFSTARTHISLVAPSQAEESSPKSPIKILASQQDQVYTPSPRRAAGVRHFAEIAQAEVSQPQGSADADVDLDGLLGDVITTDDIQFMKVLSSPRREHCQERRKLMPSLSAPKMRADGTEEVNPAQPPEALEDPKERTGTVGDDEHQDPDICDLEAPRPAATQPPSLPSVILQDSPSKANKAPVSTPAYENVLTGTQDSVKKREMAGANAVSQLLSSNRAKSSSKLKRVIGKRKTNKSRSVATKPGGKERKSRDVTSTGKSNARSRMTVDIPSQTEQPNGALLEQQDVSMGDASMEEAALAQESLGTTEYPEIIAPNRIFAFFKGKGTYNNYYPATWLGLAANGYSFKVRFDDGTITSVQPDQVCSLVLHVGDSVRELHFNGHVQACVIQGFGPVAHTDEERALGTDQSGRTVLKVRAKPAGGRISTPSSSAASSEQNGANDVLLTNIYLTRNMWPHFKNRTFEPPHSNDINEDRAGTPLTTVRSSEDGTPASRARRTVVGTGSVAGNSRLREASVTSISGRSTNTIFSGMAFALSFGTNDSEKKSVTHQIHQNGGIILEDELDELFEIHDCEGPAGTTPKQRLHKEGEQGPQSNILRLKPQYQNLGFVALITDSYSRRAKYIQALSLGLPTLSGRWIHDSVNPAKNLSLHSVDATTLDWARYLLPAGESSYLGNVVRSRTIPIYPAASAKLAHTIANRDVLLGGSGVLLVVPKKGTGNKALWQRHKPFAFLTLALGAGAVQRIDDLAEAKVLLRQDPKRWKWVYVDGDVAAANWQLSGKKGAKPRTKSKLDFVSCACGNGATVVGDEFVIQSLILSALVD